MSVILIRCYRLYPTNFRSSLYLVTRGKKSKYSVDDAVEAEILSEKNTSSSPPKQSMISKIGERIKFFFGMDEESRRRREQERMINDTVNTALRGTGVFGAIFGSFLKTGIKLVSNSIAENTRDISNLQQATEMALLSNERAVNILGARVKCDQPFSTSISSVTADGKMNKLLQVNMNVVGNAGLGVVSVSAGVDAQGDLTLKTIFLRSPNGATFQVPIDKTKKTVIIDV
jgi:hypothetical protein